VLASSAHIRSVRAAWDLRAITTGRREQGYNDRHPARATVYPVRSQPAHLQRPGQWARHQGIENYPGCTVEVEVSYPFEFLYPFIYNSTIALPISSEMVISH